MQRARLVGLVLVASVSWLPVAPPEHVHESEHDHYAVVHRHLAAHSPLHHVDGHDGVVDDNDHVLTLDPSYSLPAATPFVTAPALNVIAILEPPPVRTLHRPREYVEQLNHGPPRTPASLRAPPFISRL